MSLPIEDVPGEAARSALEQKQQKEAIAEAEPKAPSLRNTISTLRRSLTT